MTVQILTKAIMTSPIIPISWQMSFLLQEAHLFWCGVRTANFAAKMKKSEINRRVSNI